MRRQLLIRIFIPLAALAAIVSVAAMTTQSWVTPEIAERMRNGTLDNCAAWWYPDQYVEPCVMSGMAQMLDEGGPAAVQRIDQISDMHPKVLGSQCHVRMHVVAKEYAFDQGVTPQNVARLMPSDPNVNCAAGYMHGVMIALAGSISADDDLSGLLATCAGLDTALLRKNCTHGFGHTFMRVTDANVRDSLAMCSKLGETAMDCAPGAFHELAFSMAAFDDSSMARVNARTPAQMCEPFARTSLQYAQACWVRMLDGTLFQLPPLKTPADVSAFCGKLEGNNRGGCFTGAGWAWIGEIGAGRAADLCAEIGNEDGFRCIQSNSGRGGSGPVEDVNEILSVCTRFEGPWQDRCAAWFGQVLSLMSGKPIDCSAVGRTLQAACEQGVARRDDPVGVF